MRYVRDEKQVPVVQSTDVSNIEHQLLLQVMHFDQPAIH